ncbi:MAG: hypothetical protein EOP10_19035 [Proteobacteria bacterium]|nr:MAG: hypothetical protein EOP10_19035 [Pseudomonadota bacterium]
MQWNRAASTFLAEEGLMVAVLAFASPTDLSINWGLALSAIGILLLAWEYGYLERLPQIVGPYRIVRNPHSLALWLMSFSLALTARSFPAVILSLILLPWLFYIDHEETVAQPSTHMLRYRYRVPALIPTLIPFEASPNLGYSWRRAVKIHKWPSRSRLVAALVMGVYLSVTFHFNLPFWAGLIVSGIYIGIKLMYNLGKSGRIAFRKKLQLSRKPL